MKKLGIILILLVACGLLTYRFAPGFILDTSQKLFLLHGGFEQEVITIDGYTVHYLDNQQSEKPLIVFLHGYCDSKEAWLPFINSFSSDYHILVPDLLGHGDNLKDTAINHSFESQAVYLHGFFQALKVPAFHLVGISMGGGVAGMYASLYSEQLLSVAFISPAGVVGCAERSKLDKTMLTYKSVQEKRDRFPLLPKEYTREEIQEFKKYVVHRDQFFPFHLLKKHLQRTEEERSFYLDVLDDLVDFSSGEYLQPLDSSLSNVSCPSMLIWGKQDPLLHVSCAEVFKEQLPNLTDFILLDDCGHASIVEQAQKTKSALEKFLAANTP